MADIQQYLDRIANAQKGEDVRWSIHDSIEKINQEVGIATSTANASKTAAENAATIAEQAAAAANTAAGSVENATWLTNLFEVMPNKKAFVRHRNLGEFTDEWYYRINNGLFEDFCVGDYWSDEMGDGKIMIVDIDYYGKRFPHSRSVDVVDVKGVTSRWLQPSLLRASLGYTDCVLNASILNEVQNEVIRHFESVGINPNKHIASIRKSTQYSKGTMQSLQKQFWIPSVMQITGSFLPATGANYTMYNQPYTDDWQQWALCKLDVNSLLEHVDENSKVLLREICSFDANGDATYVYTYFVNGLSNSQITNTTTKILASATIM